MGQEESSIGKAPVIDTFIVVNLPADILPINEERLLCKGLGFVPSNDMDIFQTLRNVNKFVCDLTVKKHLCLSLGMSLAN